MPAGCVYVGRPSFWGNPFDWTCGDNGWDREAAVEDYRHWINERAWLQDALRMKAQTELRGKDLACWCGLDCACHADVLLELANTDD